MKYLLVTFEIVPSSRGIGRDFEAVATDPVGYGGRPPPVRFGKSGWAMTRRGARRRIARSLFARRQPYPFALTVKEPTT